MPTASRPCGASSSPRGHGDHETEEQSLAKRNLEPSRDTERGHDRDPDLDRATEQYRTPQLADPVQRQLEADAEQQQHHADLGQHLDAVHVVDQPQGARTDEDAGDDVTRDRRHAQTAEQRDDGERRHEDDHEVVEEIEFVHGRFPRLAGRG